MILKEPKKFKFYKKYLEITDDYKDIVDCNLIFFANPSQNLRKDLKKLPKNINSKFVICCKEWKIKLINL